MPVSLVCRSPPPRSTSEQDPRSERNYCKEEPRSLPPCPHSGILAARARVDFPSVGNANVRDYAKSCADLNIHFGESKKAKLPFGMLTLQLRLSYLLALLSNDMLYSVGGMYLCDFVSFQVDGKISISFLLPLSNESSLVIFQCFLGGSFRSPSLRHSGFDLVFS